MHRETSLPRASRFNCLFILTALCLLAPQLLWAQGRKSTIQQSTAGDLFVEGYAPFGTFKFAGGELSSSSFSGGVEYDKHTFGRHMNSFANFVGARMDYSAEILPLFLLRQPVVTDIWGDGLTPAKKIVPGLGISPLGLRTVWLSNRAVNPYWSVKLGVACFTQKALSTQATYVNFTIQTSAGMQSRLTDQTDMRVGFEFFHVSNAYIHTSNPGLDTLGINFGINYHLPNQTWSLKRPFSHGAHFKTAAETQHEDGSEDKQPLKPSPPAQ